MHQTQIEGRMAVRRLLDPLSAVFPKASPRLWTGIISHLWEGIRVLQDLSRTVIHAACYHWTSFLKTLLLLSHSNSMSLHFLIGKMDMFMFSLLAYLYCC